MGTLNGDPTAGDYDDFSYRPDRCELAKLRESHAKGVQGFSKVLYQNDRLTLVEEWAEVSAEEFGRKLVGLLNAWFRHFPQMFAVIERCWLRALLQPQHFPDSRDFIGNRVLGLAQHLQGNFAVMPYKVGFSVACGRPWGQQHPLVIDTKVNSWRDNRSVWVEVGCTTPLSPPINSTNVDRAQLPFSKSKDFLESEVVNLLEGLDNEIGPTGNAESKG